MDSLGAALAPLALADATPDPPGSACGSPCSVASDCSSVASADFDGLLSPSAAGPPALLSEDLPAASASAATAAGLACRSVFALDAPPRWGLESVQGRRPEMEDAAAVVPRFHRVPLWMVAADAAAADGLDRASFRLPAHFFAVYDGHGGAQVADYCRDRLHAALVEDLRATEDGAGPDDLMSSVDSKKQWEKVFVDCFCRVDAEVGARPVAPDTVGTTAVVAVVCSSHVIVANCRDSRAVLCRGKEPLPLSLDHKPNREDEYARIEALGGKVIQWNGYRVLCILAMSHSIGDRYLKIPETLHNPRTRGRTCSPSKRRCGHCYAGYSMHLGSILASVHFRCVVVGYKKKYWTGRC